MEEDPLIGESEITNETGAGKNNETPGRNAGFCTDSLRSAAALSSAFSVKLSEIETHFSKPVIEII